MRVVTNHVPLSEPAGHDAPWRGRDLGMEHSFRGPWDGL
jgi:hypothetical protein